VTSPEAALTGNDVTGSEVDYIKGVQGNPRVSHTKQQKDRSRSESYEESKDEFTIQGEDEPITSGEHAIEVVAGSGRYAELTEWNGTKRVDLRFWENDKVPTKVGVSLSLPQWKVLCSATQVVDDLISRVKDREPVDWKYHLGADI
jgi:hypothetical protein